MADAKNTLLSFHVIPTGFDKLTSQMPCSAWMIKPAVVKSNKSGRDEDDEEDEEGSDAKTDDGCILKLKHDEFLMEFQHTELLAPETSLYLHV